MRFRKNNLGLSLIELLVSMFIVSFVLAGVVAVVSTSRISFETEKESSFIQENARYALEILARDVRQAGAKDCASLDYSWYAAVVDDSTGLFGVEGVEGYEGIVTTPVPFLPVTNFTLPLDDSGTAFTPDSDALIVRYADMSEAIPIINHNRSARQLVFGSAGDFEAGEKLFIVDASCRHYGYFEATAVAGGASPNIRHFASGSNCTDTIHPGVVSHDCSNVPSPGSITEYAPGSLVAPYRISGYFIDGSNVIPGVPALKRMKFTATGQRAEEVAQGVESMQVTYAVDIDGDDVVDAFVNADEVDDWDTSIGVAGEPDWHLVKAVRITLVLRSETTQFEPVGATGTTANVVTIDGQNYSDGYLRQRVSTTITLRN